MTHPQHLSRPTRRSLLTAAGGLAAAGALAGCSGMDVTQPRGPGRLNAVTRRNVTLRMGILPSPAEDAWTRALVDDFQKLHPNIRIDLQANAQIVDLKSVVTSAMSDDLPDIMFSTDVLAQTQAAKGMLLDLTPYMKAYGYAEDDFVGKIMDLGRWKGRQYVLPRGLDQVVVAYNPQLFEQFGVEEPELGWSWEDFTAASRKLTRKKGDRQYYAMGTGWTYVQYPVYVPFMRGWGGDLSTADGSRVTLDDPRVVEGVRNMMRYFGTASPAFALPPTDPFLGGTAAMTLVARPQALGLFANPERTKWILPFTPKFTSFPLFPTPKIGAGMAGWAGTVNTRHPQETAAFLMYTLSERGQRAYAKAAGEVPIRTSLVKDDSWQDVMNFGGKETDQRAFYAYGDYQSFPPSNLPLVSNAQMSTAVGDAFTAIRIGSATPEAAMRRCNRSVNDTLVGLQ